jgi:hypothetical protein
MGVSSALGWVDIGTSTGVQSGFVYFHKKNTENGKKVFWSSDLLTFLTFSVSSIYVMVQNFFSQYGVDGYQKKQNIT